MKLTTAKLAAAFKEYGPQYMKDWEDLEERRNKLGEMLEVFDCVGITWSHSNKEWVKLCGLLGLDPNMD